MGTFSRQSLRYFHCLSDWWDSKTERCGLELPIGLSGKTVNNNDGTKFWFSIGKSDSVKSRLWCRKPTVCKVCGFAKLTKHFLKVNLQVCHLFQRHNKQLFKTTQPLNVHGQTPKKIVKETKTMIVLLVVLLVALLVVLVVVLVVLVVVVFVVVFFIIFIIIINITICQSLEKGQMTRTSPIYAVDGTDTLTETLMCQGGWEFDSWWHLNYIQLVNQGEKHVSQNHIFTLWDTMHKLVFHIY